mmetsp:Transcript_15880/g.24452  ORF Transcript_15880/g.24452 Transcript_15880/m.24452 type:complete len:169 (+) Transcript_15880:1219-1725(+)
MEKKETYLQCKEAKWISIEAIMKDYAEDDEELREKFREAKFALIYSKRITNFVHESEKSKKECKYLKQEIERLRKLLSSNDLGLIDEDLVRKIEVTEIFNSERINAEEAEEMLSPKYQALGYDYGENGTRFQVAKPRGRSGNKRHPDDDMKQYIKTYAVNTIGLPEYK